MINENHIYRIAQRALKKADEFRDTGDSLNEQCYTCIYESLMWVLDNGEVDDMFMKDMGLIMVPEEK